MRDAAAPTDDAALDDAALCVTCGRPVAGSRAVVFPCTHAWHEACLHAGGRGAEPTQCLVCGEAVIATIDLPFD